MENAQKKQNRPIIEYLPDSAERILSSLARYKFLSASQLAALGVASNTRQVNRCLREFGQKAPDCVDAVTFPPRTDGRIAQLHYLTERGGELVADLFGLEESEIKRPKGKTDLISSIEYFHRTHTIDFFISFGKWADANGFDIHVMDGYFDKFGANHGGGGAKLTAKNRIEISDGFFIADGVVHFGKDGKDYLFMVEIYNQTRTKRVTEQLKSHVMAIEEDAPSRKYKFDRGCRVAVVFEREIDKIKAIARMRSDEYFEEFANHFLFKTLDELGDFHGGWDRLDRKKGSFT